MKKMLSLLLASVLVFSLTACGGNSGGGAAPAESSGGSDSGGSSGGSTAAPDEVFDVTFQMTFPEAQARATQAILDKMTEESGGRLNFETYYSFSLVGPPDVVGAFQDGTLDMAGVMTSEYPGLFNLNGTLFGLPFLGFPSEEAATDIFNDMMATNEAMQKEFSDNGIVYYTSWVLPPYQLYTGSSKAITEPDFAGQTLMTENAYMQKFINKYGGAAMLSFPPDFYANLNNGVADGLAQHLNCLSAFGCIELAKSATHFGDGGIYVYPLSYGFSEQFWNSLPSDLQDIFLKYADEMSQACLQSDLDQLTDNYKALEDSGADIVHLTPEQIAVWEEAFADIREEALDTLSQANPAAREVYTELVEKINSYK